jgi:poly-gamma-glutamate synthesis protein (capsule biosynthesis protein)
VEHRRTEEKTMEHPNAGAGPTHMGRRRFLTVAGATALGMASEEGPAGGFRVERPRTGRSESPNPLPGNAISLFLCGDVMTGRGIDQILPHPGNPVLFEPYVKDAGEYVRLAEIGHGPIPRPAHFSYVWGDALAELSRLRPDVRIINLETAVTTSDERYSKAVSYRMNPRNFPCVTAAAIDCCTLANNHVLDWGIGGLEETLTTLEGAGVPWTGAGRGAAEAEAPVAVDVEGKGRVLVFGVGAASSGIPRDWAATADRPGIHLLPDLSPATVRRLGDSVAEHKREGDVVVASIHWGSNWGYEVSAGEVAFAHGLIDHAGVDVVHGHSSHHVKGLEVYAGKLVLYGCGDFLTDYEGIGGHDAFRGEVGAMFFPRVDPASGELLQLQLVPTRMRGFRVNRASRADARWLKGVLDREGTRLGTRAELRPDGTIAMGW